MKARIKSLVLIALLGAPDLAGALQHRDAKPINTNYLLLDNQQQIHSRQRHRAGFDETNDGIATSSTDDMFAFSSIIAGGDKVSEVTKELEKDTQTQRKISDEDEAVLAFSNTLPGNDDEPIHVEINQKQAEAEKKAQAELAEFNSNDATSAFSALV